MSDSATNDVKFTMRGKRSSQPFLWLGNEFFDLYGPIIGPHCFEVYAYFARRVHSNPSLEHAVREIAESCHLKPTTVWRSLEVLEHLQLIQLIRFGGCRKSGCKLPDVWAVAKCLGAEFDRKAQSYRFPESVSLRLTKEVCEIRARQQGKSLRKAAIPAVTACGNHIGSVSQRNTNVSPEKHECSSRETQTGPSLLKEVERTVNNLTPTPFHEGEAEKTKALSDEGGPVSELLTWTRTQFTGVMKDVKNHFLGDGIHIRPLPNGVTEWEKCGFEHWWIERADWQAGGLVLFLPVSDSASAKGALARYRSQWDEALGKWFKFKPRLEFVQAKGGARP